MEDRVLYKSNYSELVGRTIEGCKHEFEVLKLRPAVAAIITDKSWEHLLLVKQYRPAANKITWEIPAGMMDKDGEAPEECLIREVKEECNLDIISKTLHLEFNYFPMIGWSDHKVAIYSGRVTEPLKDVKIENDDSVVEAKWFNIRELAALIEGDSKIIDGKTLLAVQTLFAAFLGKIANQII